jgi:hypothetical protein
MAGQARKTQKKINHETHPSTSSGQANHTKKIIVNFLLRKNLTIDFMKNAQKNKNMADCITEYPMSKCFGGGIEGAIGSNQFRKVEFIR